MTPLFIDVYFNDGNARFEAFFLTKSGKKEILTGSEDLDRVLTNIQDETAWQEQGRFMKRVRVKYKGPVSITFSEAFGETVVSRSRGGLQMGQSSQDAAARDLDSTVRTIVPIVWNEFKTKHPELTTGFYHQPKMSKLEFAAIIGNSTISFGCQPDGGIIFNQAGTPVLAFEAKKQGAVGNAFERWFKNFMFLQCVNPDLAMITFLVGQGCLSNERGEANGMIGIARGAMALESFKRGRNETYIENGFNGAVPSFFTSSLGFSSEKLKSIVTLCLEKHFGVNM